MDNHSPRQTLPPDADRVLILANPKAGSASGKRSVDALVAALGRHRLTAEIVPHPDELAGRAAAVQSSGRLRALVGAGGDGTIAELINRAPPGVPITTLPLGTENLLAKYLDMPRAPSEVAEVIAAGTVVQHDAGRAGDRLFALMVSCGFDAEVVRRLHENRHGNISHWSYFKPIWQTIRSYEYPELRVYCDPGGPGGEDSAPAGGTLIRARFAFVFNIPRYAFGFRFAPDALGDDGLLDVCTFRHGSFGHGLWYLMNVILQRHPRIAGCTMLRTRRVRIEADEPVPYNLDGDHCGYLPLDIEIEPDRLTLLVPPGWAERRYSHSSVHKRTG